METTRRGFVRLSGGLMLAELLPAQLANRPGDTLPVKNSNGIFLEAEQFADTGGWDTDLQKSASGTRVIQIRSHILFRSSRCS